MITPLSITSRRSVKLIASHIKFSVKSGAAATPTTPTTRSFRASATRREIQPPIDDPTITNGPSVSASITASVSAIHRPIVPSSNRPSLTPWPE